MEGVHSSERWRYCSWSRPSLSSLARREPPLFRRVLPFILLSLVSFNSSAFGQTTLSPATLAFGNEALNETSASKTATLRNTQTTPLTISSISISGTDMGDFAPGGNCPLSPNTLAAGKTCAITVTFTPSALGSRTATLTLTDDASTSPQTVTLTGTGAEAAALSPAALAFGNVADGTTSTTRTATLTNNQSIALSITSITASRDFAVTGGTCPVSGSLAAKSHCTVLVALTPTIVGAESGTLTVTDNASNNPQTAALTGSSIVPVMLSPATSLSFGSVYVGNTSATKAVVLTNHGNVAVSFTSISPSGDFAIASNTCGASVPASKTCSVGVQFSPAVIGAESGALTFSDSAANSPQTISFTGTGSEPLTAAPTALTFANTAVGKTSAPKIITLMNHLSTTLTISNPTASGDFAVVSNTCATPVDGGKTCAVGVNFTPTAAGPRTGTLTIPYVGPGSPTTAGTVSGASVAITSNATDSPTTISLSGTGTYTVLLQWTASSTPGVTYNVFRGTSPGGESTTPLNASPLTVSHFADTHVTSGQTYYYTVEAVNSEGSSGPSNEAQVNVP